MELQKKWWRMLPQSVQKLHEYDRLLLALRSHQYRTATAEFPETNLSPISKQQLVHNTTCNMQDKTKKISVEMLSLKLANCNELYGGWEYPT